MLHSWVCANGDVGCFVGHNAFIRWSALQEIAQWKEDEKRWQIWSKSHVSEGLWSYDSLYFEGGTLTNPFLPEPDFDCALRMLVAGYDVRWATYSNGGFQEGVSSSADDEINRWQSESRKRLQLRADADRLLSLQSMPSAFRSFFCIA